MTRMSAFVFGLFIGAAGYFVAENFYVVRSNESIHFVRKVAAKMESPYRDIRNYTVADWQNDPALALALVKSRGKALAPMTEPESSPSQFQGPLQDFLSSL